MEDEDSVDTIQSLEAIRNTVQNTISDAPVEILVTPPPQTGFTSTATPNQSSSDDGIMICENGLDFFADTILSPELSATCDKLLASHSISSLQDGLL